MKTQLLIGLTLICGAMSAHAAPAKISHDRAVQIAKQHVGGGRATDVDVYRNGTYSVEIQKGCHQYEVRIDKNGRARTVETDYDCDND